MIVPRAFTAQSRDLSEKLDCLGRDARSRPDKRARSPLSTSSSSISPTRTPAYDSRSDPVKIPERKQRLATQPGQRPLPVPVQDVNVDSKPKQMVRKRESVQDILAATTIPVRRRPRGRFSQRLPDCDYVADFSRLLMDDVKQTHEGSLSRSSSNSQLDALFGNIDELVDGQIIVDSGSVDESILTTRSPPSDSDVSLASIDDFSVCEPASNQSPAARSFQERRFRQMASSEDCAGDHPLLRAEEDDSVVPERPHATPLRSSPSSMAKKSGSLKSSLTASLKAIRSAAQSVSARTSLFSSHQSDRLARSFFDIQPSLTDDRRPPLHSNPPSPELRRYLNPYTSIAPPDSPAQLHFWHDDGHTFVPKNKKHKSKSRRKSSRRRSISPPLVDNLPPVVQLATCLPPAVRTAHASSPPIWIAPDGTPSNKQTAVPLLHDPSVAAENGSVIPRTREPRENRDFLRVFVCEMQMRRKGKLSDDLNAGRAKLWLPPINDGLQNNKGEIGILDQNSGAGTTRVKEASERWKAWNADDI